MKKKMVIFKAILLSIIIFSSFTRLILFDIESSNKDYSLPHTADTHLLWNSMLAYEPNQVAVSDNGDYIICCMEWFNGMVSLFHRANSTALWNYTMTNTSPRSVDISADGKYIFVGCNNGTVYLFNNTKSELKTFEWSYSIGEPVVDVAISADGNYAVAGTAGNDIICLFNVTCPSDPFIWSNPDPSDNVYTVSISADGSYIAAGSGSSVYLYERSSSTPQWSDSTNAFKNCVEISADGNYIAVGCTAGYIYFYNNTSDIPMWEDNSLSGDIYSLDITDDGSYFVVGGMNGICCLYNQTGPTPEHEYFIFGSNYVYGVSISKDGNYVAAGYQYIPDSGLNSVFFYNRTSFLPNWSYKTDSSIYCVALSANGSYLAAGGTFTETSLYYFTTLSMVPDPISEYNLTSGYAEVGTTFIYEIIEWNETLANSLGVDLSAYFPNAGLGKKRCYEITNVLSTSTYWTIVYRAWDWTINEDNFHKTTPFNGMNFNIYLDPADYGSNIINIHDDLSIILKPVNNYLENIDWDADITISGNNFTWTQSVYANIIEMVVTYDEEGFQRSISLLFNQEYLISIEYIGQRGSPSNESKIPGYDLYILIITIGLASCLTAMNYRKRIKL